jgi:putative ABC transport system permease protein
MPDGAWIMSLRFTLASRNLFQDRLRFIATLIGIVFSVVLVMVQMGLYLGFSRMVTTMIDHAPADLWVVAHGAKSFEDLSRLDIRDRSKLTSMDGVSDVVPVLIGFSVWRVPDDGMTPVFVVGSDLHAGGLRPWNVAAGSVDALAKPGAVAVDKTYLERLGVSGLDAEAEIGTEPVRVAALTDGIRSFTTTPYVFADLDSARRFTRFPRNLVSQFMIRLEPNADRNEVRAALQAKLPGADVLTPDEYRSRSRSFWLFGTGAGAALFAGALLGVIVGTVIVAQTLYSSTKDHLGEFATLRAMGSRRRYVYEVIVLQALLNALIGYAVAAAVGAVVVKGTASSALPVVITPELVAALFALTVVMCILSAVAAIARVIRIDPVMALAR